MKLTNMEEQMKVNLAWVGDACYIKGTTIQVAYIFKDDNCLFNGIVLGMNGNGMIENKSSREDIKESVKEILLKADKCTKYRSTISGKFISIDK